MDTYILFLSKSGLIKHRSKFKQTIKNLQDQHILANENYGEIGVFGGDFKYKLESDFTDTGLDDKIKELLPELEQAHGSAPFVSEYEFIRAKVIDEEGLIYELEEICYQHNLSTTIYQADLQSESTKTKSYHKRIEKY